MKILIALDEQAFADQIVEFMAKSKFSADSMTTLIHVVSPVLADHPMASYPLFLESVQNEMFNDGTELMEETARQLKKRLGIEVSGKVLAVGNAISQILECAAEIDADLIIVGSHGRHGLGRLLVGSVSSGVVAGAKASVLVVQMQNAESAHATEDKIVANQIGV